MIIQRIKNLWRLSSYDVPKDASSTHTTRSFADAISFPRKKMATLIDYSEPLEEFPKDETSYDTSDK